MYTFRHPLLQLSDLFPQLAGQHIAWTCSTAREMWKLLDQPKLLEATTTYDMANILSDVRV
jgi:hypothetical protein